jgi:peptidylprolyl isomerase
VTGAAKNSPVFTKAKPVPSFATPGAVGMLHDNGDRNGASASFFCIPKGSSGAAWEELRQNPILNEKLNQRFSLFAYIVQGRDVLERLRAGDVLKKVDVLDGPWQLVKLREESTESEASVSVLASGYSD